MSEEQYQNLVNAVGSLAEIIGLMHDNLIRVGFDDGDALYLCGIYLEALVTK